MNRQLLLSGLICFLLISCSHNSDSIRFSEGKGESKFLAIHTDESEYTWEFAESGEKHLIVRASLTNNSIATYYSTLGPLFGGPLNLKIARGSTGYIESYNEDSGNWEPLGAEGTILEWPKLIEIKPQIRYSITIDLGDFFEVPPSGTLRIRIDYYKNNKYLATQIPLTDYSNTFEIR